MLASGLGVLCTMTMDLLGWQIELLVEDVEDVFRDDKHEIWRDEVVLVLVLQEILHGLDGDERFVSGRVGAFRVQDRGAYDSRKVGQVHTRASLLVSVRECAHPFEEDEEDLQSVAVAARQENDQKVQASLTVFGS